MPIKAACPNCGAEVQFRLDSSFVTVCEYCSSIVARGDRGFESHGKVADLVETQSPLKLWVGGRYKNASFSLTGHSQLKHPQGGVWDEWYLAFDDGRWGWLAEAQGHFYLTFEQPEGTAAPPFESVVPGQKIPGAGGSHWSVQEKGVAEYAGAEGEIPFAYQSGKKYAFVDLVGPDKSFATFDYSERPPSVFAGVQVGLDELGMGELEAAAADKALGAASGVGKRVACPNCDGNLELVAPDKAERVGCQYCGALLDVNQGELKFLKILKRKKPNIPLGKKLRLSEIDELKPFDDFKGALTVTGYMERSTLSEGVRYYWEEYLLYHPRMGFRWLVCSAQHWSYVKPVQLSEVDVVGHGLKYAGKRYKLYQSGGAEVESVLGEFYWKVEKGQSSVTADYINPPFMVSEESTKNEVNWSASHYVDCNDLERISEVALLSPEGVAPNQPFRHKGIYGAWFKMVGFAILLAIVFSFVLLRKQVVHQQVFTLENQVDDKKTQSVFTERFDLLPGKNVKIEVEPPLASWAVVGADLVNEGTGEVSQFYLSMEREGTAPFRDEKIIAALTAGSYVLRLETLRPKSSQGGALRATVRQGVFSGINLVLLLIGLCGLPGLVMLWRFSFERRRWMYSDHAPLWMQGEE